MTGRVRLVNEEKDGRELEWRRANPSCILSKAGMEAPVKVIMVDGGVSSQKGVKEEGISCRRRSNPCRQRSRKLGGGLTRAKLMRSSDDLKTRGTRNRRLANFLGNLGTPLAISADQTDQFRANGNAVVKDGTRGIDLSDN